LYNKAKRRDAAAKAPKMAVNRVANIVRAAINAVAPQLVPHLLTINAPANDRQNQHHSKMGWTKPNTMDHVDSWTAAQKQSRPGIKNEPAGIVGSENCHARQAEGTDDDLRLHGNSSQMTKAEDKTMTKNRKNKRKARRDPAMVRTGFMAAPAMASMRRL
jgi:hypothetical protein